MRSVGNGLLFFLDWDYVFRRPLFKTFILHDGFGFVGRRHGEAESGKQRKTAPTLTQAQQGLQEHGQCQFAAEKSGTGEKEGHRRGRFVIGHLDAPLILRLIRRRNNKSPRKIVQICEGFFSSNRPHR